MVSASDVNGKRADRSYGRKKGGATDDLARLSPGAIGLPG
jgi:hypothetical protein